MSSKYPVLSRFPIFRMKPTASVGLPQLQGVYKWSSSTGWTEVYEEGKGWGWNIKQTKDQIRSQ